MTEGQAAPARLADIKRRIAAAAGAAGRDPAAVRLIAVAKSFGPDHILPALEAGHRLFGENRVQEAKAKWPALKARFPEIALHLIGPLQSNKARDAVQLFDAIHTIDRPKIARAVAEAMAEQRRRPELLVQVNTGAEPQKAGVSLADAPGLVRYVRDDLKLAVSGLMCIPPVDQEPTAHFALLARLAAELRLEQLSMGMSADFVVAVRHGATYVRVGSALFGSR